MKKLLLLTILLSSFSYSVTCQCNNGYWDLIQTDTDILDLYQAGEGLGVGASPAVPAPVETLCTTDVSYAYDTYRIEELSRIHYSAYDVVEYNRYKTRQHYSCIANPDCNATTEFLDTSVFPPVCSPNPTPICNYPDMLLLVDGVESCLSPDDITNPDGSCQVGFAKDVNGNCQSDKDNDGVPDNEDDYPDDGSKSSSDSENGVKYCQRGIMDCTVDCECPKGTLNLIGYTSLCYSFSTGESHQGKFCDVDGDANEPTDPNATTPIQECNNPPSVFGFEFQSMVATDTHCYDLRRRYAQGGVTNGFNWSCPDNTVACYYNRASDSSDSNSSSGADSGTGDANTTSGTGDLNSTTNPDANGTATIDTTNIENKLDAINDSLSADGAINNSIHDVGSLVSSSSQTNHTDLTNINSTLSNKLDSINDSIQNIPQTPATDMTDTNQKLDEIKDILNPDTTADESDLNSKVSDLKNGADNFIATYVNTWNSIKVAVGSTSAPSISTAGSCSMSKFVYGQSVDFQEGFDLFVQYLRPIMLLIVNLAFTMLLIKLAILAYSDLTMRVQWLFNN